MAKRILITGGAGFVGSAMAIGLAERWPDRQIIALDNLKRRGSELNIPRLLAAGVKFIHGDIRNTEDLNPDTLNPEIIIECSAEPSVTAGYAAPEYTVRTNLSGTVNCLELARKTGSDFIFLSTSRVYPLKHLEKLRYNEKETRFQLADEQTMPGASAFGVAENFPLDGARTLYGATKLASELLITEYSQAYGIRTIINRCGVITGPWQMGKVDQGIFALWMAAHYFKTQLKYIGYGGHGKQVRDLLHSADLLELVDTQINRITELNGETFNVGGGADNSLSLLETTELCREITGNKIEISPIAENRPGDIPVFITDARKIREKTGWHPKYSPRVTLTEIYEWLSQNAETLKPVLCHTP